MAATDARPMPRKGVAFRVGFPIFDADGDLVSGATGLDSERSIDGAGFTDCTNEATEIGSSGTYYLDLTAAEMNGDMVMVIVKTSSVGAKTTPIVLYPEEAGDIRADTTTAANTAIAVATNAVVSPDIRGADNDTLKTLSDEIASLPGAGTSNIGWYNGT